MQNKSLLCLAIGALFFGCTASGQMRSGPCWPYIDPYAFLDSLTIPISSDTIFFRIANPKAKVGIQLVSSEQMHDEIKIKAIIDNEKIFGKQFESKHKISWRQDSLE